MKTSGKKGRFTFRAAAVLFVVSAAFELFSITSEVPLFGVIIGGTGVGIYHLVYAALFLALGVGLWSATQWGYFLVFVTVSIYTIDKLQFILSRQAMESFISKQIGIYESELLSQGIDKAMISQAVVLMTVLVILCWWGFALYAYIRRDYFQPAKDA
jgi:hypothetical protein